MYAKRSADIARGKPHGSVDLGLSVISAKRRRCRIDIDAEVFIYHIKVQSKEKQQHAVSTESIPIINVLYVFFQHRR